MEVGIFKYHRRNEPIPDGWEQVHDFCGSHWSQFYYHGMYAILIRKVQS